MRQPVLALALLPALACGAPVTPDAPAEAAAALEGPVVGGFDRPDVIELERRGDETHYLDGAIGGIAARPGDEVQTLLSPTPHRYSVEIVAPEVEGGAVMGVVSLAGLSLSTLAPGTVLTSVEGDAALERPDGTVEALEFESVIGVGCSGAQAGSWTTDTAADLVIIEVEEALDPRALAVSFLFEFAEGPDLSGATTVPRFVPQE